jgi:hypothetical protein
MFQEVPFGFIVVHFISVMTTLCQVTQAKLPIDNSRASL